MKILITGGAGYKGLKLAQALLLRGHAVTILDNFMYGYDAALHLLQYDRLTVVEKDIRNLEEKDIASFDIIYHLAGISGYPACEANPNSAQMINVVGTRRLVDLLGADQYLINASTTSFYGSTGSVCSEETRIAPVSLYGITKYEAEKICLDHARCTNFRFATIFGIAPRMRWDLLPNDFTMKAVQERSLVLFDSHSIRTFLHIDDAIDAYLMALDQPDAFCGKVFNVGGHSMNLSKMELAQEINKLVDFSIIEADMPGVDLRSFIIDFGKIEALGYVPKKTIEQGIAELIKLFRFYRPTRPYNTI